MKSKFALLAVVLSQGLLISAHAEDKPEEPLTCPIHFQIVEKRVCWTDHNGIKVCRSVKGCQPIRLRKV
jgi:hypothetical protein